MHAQVVLIADSRKEIAQKYKKIIQQDCYVFPVVVSSYSSLLEKVVEQEPELIIVSDNLNMPVSEMIKDIRETAVNYRPVIVVVSKSDYTNDKILALKSGADDYICEPIDLNEFSFRIFAHLRRYIEELSDPVSNLPSVNFTYKVLQRVLDSGEKLGLMYININNLKPYEEIYGHFASDNMIKAFSALLKTSIDRGDFIGHLGESNFIIITTPQKADKIANLLNYAFDSISCRFYSENDVERGYLILDSDEKAGMRVPFVTSSIGIVSNEYRAFHDYKEAVGYAINTNKMAKLKNVSGWIYDRPRLSSSMQDLTESKRNKVLIMSADAAFAYLLRTTLEMQGYVIESVTKPLDVPVSIEDFKPNLVIFDADSKNLDSILTLASLLKSDEKSSNIKIIVSSVVHNKEKILDTGADLYLPKPFEIITLFGWIHRFLNMYY